MNKKQAIEFANQWRNRREAEYRQLRLIKRMAIGVAVVSYAVAYTIMTLVRG